MCSPIALWLSRGASAERRSCGCTIFPIRLERMRSKESGRVLTEINSWPVLFARVFITGGQLLFNEVWSYGVACRGFDRLRPLDFLGCCRHHGRRRACSFAWITKRRRCSTTAPPFNASLPLPLPSFKTPCAVFSNSSRFVRCDRSNAITSATPVNCTRCTAAKWCSASSPRGCMNCSPSPHCAASSSSACGRRIRCGVFRNPFFARTECLPRDAGHGPQPIRRLIAMRGQMHLLDAMENAGSGEAAELKHSTADRARSSTERPHRNSSAHRSLTLAYDDGEPVVRDLTAAFEPGQIHTITGASGSGKSTLISALLGLHAPQSGAIILNVRQLGAQFIRTIGLGHVAYLASNPFCSSASVGRTSRWASAGEMEDSSDG